MSAAAGMRDLKTMAGGGGNISDNSF